MGRKFSRRDVLSTLGSAGLAAGVGALGMPEIASADPAGRTDAKPGVKVTGATGHAATVVNGQVIEPEQKIPLLHETDVLVVGGGPAGVTAAIAAARAGAKTTIVERYGHFGGLWTGGLVLTVLGHWVPGPKQVCRGIGEEMLKHLDKIDRGIVGRQPGRNPIVDGEALKYVMVDMIMQAKIDVFLHCWGVDAIMDGDTILGAVFESKSGRQAILAKTVVDATGDGDVFAAAGAEHERRVYHIGLPSRIGNLDHADPKKNGGKKPRGLGSITPVAGVNWVNMHGPDADGLDVRELTRLELNHRRFIWSQVQKLRNTPGYEDVYLMETAPQLGVRITRVLSGEATITRKGLDDNRRYDDVVAVGGAWQGDHQEWQIPYGALLPKKIDNLLAAGRCISGEPLMSDLIRVIPNCWITGHAAGCAAAVAVADSCRPRDVDIRKVQKLLREQDAYLG